MKNVGILAAMTISVLGTASEVNCFFRAVVCFLESGTRGSRYPVVTERLYRRSLEYAELDELKLSLEQVRVEFDNLQVDGVDEDFFDLKETSVHLDFSGKTLADVFSRFFGIVFEAIECTSVFYEEFNEYVPLRLGFTDAPDYIFDINRSVEQYESLGLDELPFWLR